MRVEKRAIAELTLCYCVAQIQYRGEPHFLVASEKEHECLLFDEHGRLADTVWEGPGGTMSIVPLPGLDGTFLATHRFYSPNNSKEAKIVLCRHTESGWAVRTIAELPYVHRFDILERGGARYLLACCIKSGYEYKDDWRFPGMTLACRLPEDFPDNPDCVLEFTELKGGMLKNHGYCRDMHNGVMTGLVTCEEGVYRFTPPAAGESGWKIERLLAEPVSDCVMLDFDGDGRKELLTLSPFHGDTLCVYHASGEGYVKVFEYGEKIEFAHAICADIICGRPMAVIGHRKGKRDLLSVEYAGGEYRVGVIDRDVGPANVLHAVVDGKDVLLSANREINEVAYYELSER